MTLVVDMLSTPANCASDEQFRRSLEGDVYKDNVGATRYILCKLAESAMTQETWTDLWRRTDKKCSCGLSNTSSPKEKISRNVGGYDR